VAERRSIPRWRAQSITGRYGPQCRSGLFVQRATRRRYAVSDVSTMWMLASVAETDFPLLQLGST